VHAEISRGNDDLKTWVDTEITPTDLFLCDAVTLGHYATLMQWGNGNPQYNYNAKTDFSEFDNADPFVVAVAMTLSATVVSQEISAPSSVKNIKLPDTCVNFNVPHLDTFAFLRTRAFSM
jgi:hypothetical protein